jgi:hypothetical protein
MAHRFKIVEDSGDFLIVRYTGDRDSPAFDLKDKDRGLPWSSAQIRLKSSAALQERGRGPNLFHEEPGHDVGSCRPGWCR